MIYTWVPVCVGCYVEYVSRLAHAVYVQQAKQAQVEREQSRANAVKELFAGPVVGQLQGSGSPEGRDQSSPVVGATGSGRTGPSLATITEVLGCELCVLCAVFTGSCCRWVAISPLSPVPLPLSAVVRGVKVALLLRDRAGVFLLRQRVAPRLQLSLTITPGRRQPQPLPSPLNYKMGAG